MTTPKKNTQDSVPSSAPQQTTTASSVQADQAFEQRARELFREASERIDHGTAGRLRSARQTALDAARSPPHHAAGWLIPAGAFAAIALATVITWQPRSARRAPLLSRASAPSQTAEADNDLPPDAEKIDPHLYQNMDFYLWLAANKASAGAPGAPSESAER